MVKDKDLLNWLAERLVNVYGESPNCDFVQKVRAIADATHPEIETGWATANARWPLGEPVRPPCVDCGGPLTGTDKRRCTACNVVKHMG